MTRRTLRLLPGYQCFKPFFDNIPSWFDQKGEELHRGRNTVKLIRLADGTPVVVKRYCVPNLVPRLCYTFGRRSKARRAYEFAARLNDLGIDTPAPVACIEERNWGLFGLSYFVSLLDQRPSLEVLYDDLFLAHDELAAAFARFLVLMHSKGFLHGDLNLSNILYEQVELPQSPGEASPGCSFRFAVIDTNRSRFCRKPSRKRCLRNLVRITHKRSLMREIVGHYARLRGWHQEKCINWVMERLIHFEQRNKAKHALKPQTHLRQH